MTTLAVLFSASLAVACGTPAPDGELVPDSAALAAARADSQVKANAEMAPVVRDTAKATVASLLANPASATFDSVLVVQPPMVDGRWPMVAVCGRIAGRPGIGGSRTPVRFVYQNRFTVFVEEAANAEQFAELWGRVCAAEGGTVVLEG